MEEFIDMHCHILSGLDDGSRDMKQTIRMMRIAYEDGIRKIIATPHYHIGRAIAEKEKCEQAVEEVKKMLEKESIPIEIYLGAEIYYFAETVENIESGKINTMNDSRYLLVEFDPDVEYSRIRDAVNNLTMNGYIPIVAHIERYMCMVADWKKCIELINMGALIQVNAMSVIGEYGREAQKYIRKIIKKRLVHFVATDAHSDGHRRPVLSEAYKYICKKASVEYADEIFYNNQKKLIEKMY